jgi:hypothetical protein
LTGRVTITGIGTAEIYVKRLGDGNYDDSDEASITVISSESPQQPVIKRKITLPAAETGYSYDIPPGKYHVASRSNFVFTVIADKGYSLDKLKVTTAPDFKVSLDSLSTDSTRVTVYDINNEIVITVSGVVSATATGNETLPSVKVWSYNSRLYITSSTAGKAYVYNIAGVLVKILSCTAGETLSEPLEKGLYIVKTEKGTYKIRN